MFAVLRCLILAPTRELAKQVASEFESVCPSLTVVSVYGGTSINAQIDTLKRGVDVVVGTPGRIMDLLDRKKLHGDKVRGTAGGGLRERGSKRQGETGVCAAGQ